MSIPPNFNVRYELRSGHSGRPSVFSKLTCRKLITRARDGTVMLDDGVGGRGHYKISDLVAGLLHVGNDEDLPHPVSCTDADDSDDAHNGKVMELAAHGAFPRSLPIRKAMLAFVVAVLSVCVGVMWVRLDTGFKPVGALKAFNVAGVVGKWREIFAVNSVYAAEAINLVVGKWREMFAVHAVNAAEAINRVVGKWREMFRHA